MKFLKFYFLVLIIILSGCTSSYNLIIDNDSFKEEIYLNLENDVYRKYPFDENNIEFKQYPFVENNSVFYSTKVTDNGDSKDVLLSYSYTPDEFNNSNSLNSCFENVSFNNNKYSFVFDLSGKFKCLYNNDQLDINIISKNKVISNNADEVNGNVYTWHINNLNADNVSININIEKSKSTTNIFVIVIFILLVSIIVFSIVHTYKKNKIIRNQI